ncbi:MAG: uncharacterized protein PWP03_80 [Candidatus Woesearchaeota archaeon]|nr:uncharacterized protein [Candidatus Woesearchaeota archaeon]MDN5327442.1 uncharacterized protein [Candidatus Woesearchaeota archaeon]
MLSDKIKPNATIIEGFPGFGLVASIATEFLVDHLSFKLVGKVLNDQLPPLVSIRNGERFLPVPILYNEDQNLILIYGLNPVNGLEWKLARDILDLAKEINAKRIISLEGVYNPQPVEPKVLYYSNDPEIKGILSNKYEPLKNGIILGITSALMSLNENHNFTCLFGETHINLPDSAAAAKIIECLDIILNLNVNTKPLYEKAKEFETQLKELVKQAKEVSQEKKLKENLDYLG